MAAICEGCGLDMAVVDGCTVGFVLIGGKRFDRIKRGVRIRRQQVDGHNGDVVLCDTQHGDAAVAP